MRKMSVMIGSHSGWSPTWPARTLSIASRMNCSTRSSLLLAVMLESSTRRCWRNSLYTLNTFSTSLRSKVTSMTFSTPRLGSRSGSVSHGSVGSVSAGSMDWRTSAWRFLRSSLAFSAGLRVSLPSTMASSFCFSASTWSRYVGRPSYLALLASSGVCRSMNDLISSKALSPMRARSAAMRLSSVMRGGSRMYSGFGTGFFSSGSSVRPYDGITGSALRACCSYQSGMSLIVTLSWTWYWISVAVVGSAPCGRSGTSM
mmetsp:Transcript_37927/g.117209  ORF Transcript_37927/g.117209 Transcript_37927/m.117209 type:complete len:258 (-) Transcript_37927:499-1272(-)